MLSSIMAALQASDSKRSGASTDSEIAAGNGHVICKLLRWPLLAAILFAILTILGLTLGLGLGLGLKHQKKDQPLLTSGTNGVQVVSRSQLVDPSQLTLSPSFDIMAAPQSREFNWTLSEINSDPTGTSKNMLVVNGISPGPKVEANVGDRVIVHVTNNMPNATSIHWHGQNQNGTNFMDGTAGITECGIAPGSTFTYNWTVQNVGTFWWHAHHTTQYSDGLFGALILHSPNDTLKFADGSTSSSTSAGSVLDSKAKYLLQSRSSTSSAALNITYYEDLIFFVGDVYNTFSTVVLQSYLSPNGPDGNQGDEPVADGGLVNGIGKSNCNFAPAGSTCDGGANYNFTVQAGKRYRIRVINAGSFADIQFSVDGHPLTVIEADSATAIKPMQVQSVRVSVAQRYSVIIETNQRPAAYYLRGEVVTDMFKYDNAALITEQNAVMRYAGIADTVLPNDTVPELDGITQNLNTSLLVPAVPVAPPAATRTETVFVNFELTAQGLWGGFFNGSAWAAETNNATVFQTADAAIAGTSWSSVSQFIVTLCKNEKSAGIK